MGLFARNPIFSLASNHFSLTGIICELKPKTQANANHLGDFLLFFLRFRLFFFIYALEEEFMNKKAKRLIWLSTLIVFVFGLTIHGLPIRLCCIAGEYTGSTIHNSLPNCPRPKSETFSMTIFQVRGCGANVWGKITSASGDVNEFKGTLSRGRRRCCVLTASFSNPGHPGHLVTFTGTFCLSLGKWQANGTFTEINSGDPCKKGGTWGMKQI